MEEFKKELAALLEKHNVAIICHSQNNEDDHSVEIGFQDTNNGFKNTYTGRHHLNSFDLVQK
jgi:hypothetical protein